MPSKPAMDAARTYMSLASCFSDPAMKKKLLAEAIDRACEERVSAFADLACMGVELAEQILSPVRGQFLTVRDYEMAHVILDKAKETQP